MPLAIALKELQDEYNELTRNSYKRRENYYKARRRYYDYLYQLVCARSPYNGSQDQIIRVWGLRRLLILNKQVYRIRELSREPLPMERLRFSSDREEKATLFISQNAVKIKSMTRDSSGSYTLQGTVRNREKTYNPYLTNG